jgi:hypothetical protein
MAWILLIQERLMGSCWIQTERVEVYRFYSGARTGS